MVFCHLRFFYTMVKQLIDTYYKTHDLTKQAIRFIEDPRLLDELISIATSDLAHPYPESASWIMTHIQKLSPEILAPFQPQIIDTLLRSQNQSVLRNLMNVTASLELIEYKESELLDRLIAFIKDDSNKVALFVYAMYKLVQFTEKYPEIKTEILGIIALKESNPLQPSIKIGIRNYLKRTKNC